MELHVGFLVICPKFVWKMMEWLKKKIKIKNASLFSATPCIIFYFYHCCRLTSVDRVSVFVFVSTICCGTVSVLHMMASLLHLLHFSLSVVDSLDLTCLTHTCVRVCYFLWFFHSVLLALSISHASHTLVFWYNSYFSHSLSVVDFLDLTCLTYTCVSGISSQCCWLDSRASLSLGFRYDSFVLFSLTQCCWLYCCFTRLTHTCVLIYPIICLCTHSVLLALWLLLASQALVFPYAASSWHTEHRGCLLGFCWTITCRSMPPSCWHDSLIAYPSSGLYPHIVGFTPSSSATKLRIV